jgi:hypothetical protein
MKKSNNSSLNTTHKYELLLIVFLISTFLITYSKSLNTKSKKEVTVKNFYLNEQQQQQPQQFINNNSYLNEKRSIYEKFNIENMNKQSGTSKLQINTNASSSQSILNKKFKFEDKIKRENILINEIANISNQNNFNKNPNTSLRESNEIVVGIPNYQMNKLILDNNILTLQNNPMFLGFEFNSQPPDDINYKLVERLNESEIDYDLIKHGLDMSKIITNQINSYTMNKRKQEGVVMNTICDKCSNAVTFCECDEIIGLENIKEYDPIIANLVQPIIRHGKCVQKDFCLGVDAGNCSCECSCEWVLEENNTVCPYNLKDLNVVLCPCPCSIQHQQAQKLGISSIDKDKYYKDIVDKNNELDAGKIDNLKEFLDSHGLKVNSKSALASDSSFKNLKKSNKTISVAETAGELIQQGLENLKSSNLKNQLKQ